MTLKRIFVKQAVWMGNGMNGIKTAGNGKLL